MGIPSWRDVTTTAAERSISSSTPSRHRGGQQLQIRSLGGRLRQLLEEAFRGLGRPRRDHPEMGLRKRPSKLDVPEGQLVLDQTRGPQERFGFASVVGGVAAELGEARDLLNARVGTEAGAGQLELLAGLHHHALGAPQCGSIERLTPAAAVGTIEDEVQIVGSRNDQPTPVKQAERRADYQVGSASPEQIQASVRIGQGPPVLERPPTACPANRGGPPTACA